MDVIFSPEETRLVGAGATLVSVLYGMVYELSVGQLAFYNWFYMLCAWLHFSWKTIEPFFDQFDVDLTPDQVEGLGDVAFAGFAGYLVQYAINFYERSMFSWSYLVPVGVTAGLLIEELQNPWLSFSQGQLNLVWLLAMANTFMVNASCDCLVEELVVAAGAWTAFVVYLGTQFSVDGEGTDFIDDMTD